MDGQDRDRRRLPGGRLEIRRWLRRLLWGRATLSVLPRRRWLWRGPRAPPRPRPPWRAAAAPAASRPYCPRRQQETRTKQTNKPTASRGEEVDRSFHPHVLPWSDRSTWTCRFVFHLIGATIGAPHYKSVTANTPGRGWKQNSNTKRVENLFSHRQ